MLEARDAREKFDINLVKKKINDEIKTLASSARRLEYNLSMINDEDISEIKKHFESKKFMVSDDLYHRKGWILIEW